MKDDTRNLAVLTLWLLLAALTCWGMWGLEIASTKSDQLARLLATGIGGFSNLTLLNHWLTEEQEGPKDL